MIRELLINLGFIYDPSRFALQPSAKHAPAPVRVKAPVSLGVQHTPNLGVPNRVNQTETDDDAGVISYEVLSQKEAMSGKTVTLSPAELEALEAQRIKTKFRLPLEHCLDVKRGLAQGLSLSQIAKKNEGIKGMSLRAIKAISSAINSQSK